MCVRRGVLPSPPVAFKGIAVKHLRMRKNLAKWLPHRFCKHSLVLRNKRIRSSLFLSKTCDNFHTGFEIFSCFHWSSLTILIVAHQRDGALVPVPLMSKCGVRDVDRREVVQVLAIFYYPSVGLLRISILFMLLPPDYDGALILFPCSSSGIHCFPMVLSPLSLAVFLAPLSDSLVQGNKGLSELGIWL